MLLDIDKFKQISAAQGSTVGDSILQHVAEKLRKVAPSKAVISRLGEDEFALIIPNMEDRLEIMALARLILNVCHHSFTYEGNALHVTASMGICLSPEHGTHAEELMQYADMAMYQARRQGRGGIVIYEPSLHQEEQGRYLGFLKPDEFIRVAEENGSIIEIGYWVLSTACEQHRSWIQEGMPTMLLSINLSARQLLDPDFSRRLADTLLLIGIHPAQLCLEIKGFTVMYDGEKVLSVCREIRSIGVKLSIDDFGTGYSSLALLRELSLHAVKIDRSFVKDMLRSKNDQAIVHTMI